MHLVARASTPLKHAPPLHCGTFLFNLDYGRCPQKCSAIVGQEAPSCEPKSHRYEAVALIVVGGPGATGGGAGAVGRWRDGRVLQPRATPPPAARPAVRPAAALQQPPASQPASRPGGGECGRPRPGCGQCRTPLGARKASPPVRCTHHLVLMENDNYVEAEGQPVSGRAPR